LSWGIKDQYEVNGSEAANNTGNLILKIAFDLHDMIRPSIRMNGYRGWILLEATGGPDDIYHGEVFARHTDSEGSRSPDKIGSGNPKIRYKYFTRADDANTRYTMCSNALQRQYY
jgi:hypothetical protein